MSYSSKLMENAVDALSRLPGIGKKSALRLALHLIREDKNTVLDAFVEPLRALAEQIMFCKTCNNISDTEKCSICTERESKSDTICIVESIRDVMAIEDTGQYNGLYHVLGGVISPLDGVSAEDLSIQQFFDRIKDQNITEVIMALSPTIEGETTIYYISKGLKDSGIHISQLARGISFGGDLEFADELTLGRSILTRTDYQIKEL